MSDLKTPNGWPSQGEQPNGSWIEYIFYPHTHNIRTFVTHDDYASYLLKRRGSNKQRLLMRIYIAKGYDPKDYLAINEWLNDHKDARSWTFKEIHRIYQTDQLLPPEFRYHG